MMIDKIHARSLSGSVYSLRMHTEGEINMNNITFSPCILYMGSPGGEMRPIGEVKETNFYEPVSDATCEKTNEILTGTEATLTITLTKKMAKALIEQLFEMRELILNMVQEKGYSQIAYLARHARKHRTRKKNLFRAYHILEIDVNTKVK